MTAFRFHYEGPTPSKKNSKSPMVAKSGKAYLPPNFVYAKWLPGAIWMMKAQMAKQPGIRFPIQRCKQVYLKIYFQDLRERDNDNVYTTVMDLAVRAGILTTDSWIITGPTGQFPYLRRDHPGWELVVETFDAAPGPSEQHNYVMPSKP